MEASGVRPQLAGVVCPECHSRVGVVALVGGPVLLRHQADRVTPAGRTRCRSTWVAVPDPVAGRVDMISVEGRAGEEILGREVERWLAERYQAMADVFGFAMPGAA